MSPQESLQERAARSVLFSLSTNDRHVQGGSLLSARGQFIDAVRGRYLVAEQLPVSCLSLLFTSTSTYIVLCSTAKHTYLVMYHVCDIGWKLTLHNTSMVHSRSAIMYGLHGTLIIHVLYTTCYVHLFLSHAK